MTQFYLRDTRSDVGSTCMFWAANHGGYVSDLDEAELFDQEIAQNYADEQRHFIPLSKERIDEVATYRVDHQDINEAGNDYSQGGIIYHLGRWDGNDVYFTSETGLTINYKDARVYTEQELKGLSLSERQVVLPKVFLDKIARRTVQSENVNHRKMMTAAGIRYRTPRKSKATGMTRHNCPDCGVIVWDYDPHEAPKCARCG